VSLSPFEMPAKSTPLDLSGHSTFKRHGIIAQSPAGLLNQSGGQVTDETSPKSRTNEAILIYKSNQSGFAIKESTKENMKISKEGTQQNTKSKVDVSESEEEKGLWDVPDELRSTSTRHDSQIAKSYLHRIVVAA
jgi:ABC-type transport system involved in cytochrome c biogenesis ATPase subunit